MDSRLVVVPWYETTYFVLSLEMSEEELEYSSSDSEE